eukprot:6553173-Prymnesium_polylepis.1
MGWSWGGRAVRDAALVVGKRASMMQGGGGVQAGPSGTAAPAYGARGGRPIFAADARLSARRMRKKLQPCAWRHVAK